MTDFLCLRERQNCDFADLFFAIASYLKLAALGLELVTKHFFCGLQVEFCYAIAGIYYGLRFRLTGSTHINC